ncbi:MAG TPA: SdiA-regulated domain-containing protein [Chitinophagaceae bacterium]|nr:SdiA-regulated domain-containing protein [Chitinophagaceae bacterium]
MKRNYWAVCLMTGIVILFLLSSCYEKADNKKKETKEEVRNAPLQQTNYDLLHPVGKWVLSDSLAEISGIAFLKNDKLLAIEDMRPILYELKLGDTASTIINKTEFKETDKEKFDFEDLAVAHDTVYALWSHGAIFKIIKQKKGVTSERTKTWLKKDNNTEGLAYDPISGNLLVACKDDAGLEDVKKTTRAIFEFDTKGDSLKHDPFMLINKSDFENVAGDKIDFYPAAIAVQPATHDIFIISTKDTKCIAQFTHDGKLKAFDYLEKEMLPQPEGVCFDTKGNLYISTEARHGKPAYIYEFAVKK